MRKLGTCAQMRLTIRFMIHEFRTTVALILLILPCARSGMSQQKLSSGSADQVWRDLAAGNRRFVLGKSAAQDFSARRAALTKAQQPRVAVLSCSDSRLPPELVFDAGLGEMFVVRTAGEDDDPLAIGSLEYAVEHLGSIVIVVLGHQSCGAVTAACSARKSDSVNLDAVTMPITPSCAQFDPRHPQTLDLAIRDHVHRVAEELLAKSSVLKKALDEGKLTIIEAYYSLDTGAVTKLR